MLTHTFKKSVSKRHSYFTTNESVYLCMRVVCKYIQLTLQRMAIITIIFFTVIHKFQRKCSISFTSRHRDLYAIINVRKSV